MSQKRRLGAIVMYVMMALLFGALLVVGMRLLNQDWKKAEIAPTTVVDQHHEPKEALQEPVKEKREEALSPESNSSTQQPSHLPQTGGTSTPIGALGLSAVVAMMVAYVQSRRYRTAL